MRPPRFRVRTLMVAVAVVASLIWGSTMGARSLDYYRRWRAYDSQEVAWRAEAARGRGNPQDTRSIGAKWGPQVADYYGMLARKYREAMWCPWRPVAPDPHAPGFDQWLEQEHRANRPPYLRDLTPAGPSGRPRAGR